MESGNVSGTYIVITMYIICNLGIVDGVTPVTDEVKDVERLRRITPHSVEKGIRGPGGVAAAR